MDAWVLFSTLGYGTLFLYFVTQIVLAPAPRSSCSWLWCPLDIPRHCVLCILFVRVPSTSFLSETARHSRLLLCVFWPGPVSALPQEAGFLWLKNEIRSQEPSGGLWFVFHIINYLWSSDSTGMWGGEGGLNFRVRSYICFPYFPLINCPG